jgi:hypothetical protein
MSGQYLSFDQPRWTLLMAPALAATSRAPSMPHVPARRVDLFQAGLICGLGPVHTKADGSAWFVFVQGRCSGGNQRLRNTSLDKIFRRTSRKFRQRRFRQIDCLPDAR